MPCQVIVPYPIYLNYTVGMPFPRSCGSADPASECSDCEVSASALETLRLEAGEFIAKQLAAAGAAAQKLNVSLSKRLEWDALRALVLLHALDCPINVCDTSSRLKRHIATCQ